MPHPIDYLPWDRYLDSIRTDTDRLLEVATDLRAPVPSCPGWTVADLLEHVGVVYLHKVACMRQGRSPQPWPPSDLDSDPVALLGRGRDALLAELTSRDPYEQRFTWYPPDQTNGFWYRRMALEVAVHRVDGELAAGVTTPVPADVALDGIDEILRIMLIDPSAHPEKDYRPEHLLDARLRVTADGRSWTVVSTPKAVEVAAETDSEVDTEIAGPASDVFLWLWGRQRVEMLSVSGDDDLATQLRARLAEDD